MLPARSWDDDKQLFQRTLLCSWDFGIGDPLLYVGQESTATGKARSASRSISSHSVEPLCTGVGSSLPSLVFCKAMMSMPYLTVSSLSSTTLVIKQSQVHCRIVRRCLFCSGISVLRLTAAGWLVALCTDAQRWQVHASTALNLCRASWVSLAQFTWNCCRHATQTRGLRT